MHNPNPIVEPSNIEAIAEKYFDADEIALLKSSSDLFCPVMMEVAPMQADEWIQFAIVTLPSLKKYK